VFRRVLQSRFRESGLAASVLATFFGIALFSTPAVAGEKEEARRHFKAGMQAISDGQYEKGIAELKEAYAILPHANVLYNIARAYAESGQQVIELTIPRNLVVFEIGTDYILGRSEDSDGEHHVVIYRLRRTD